jgi:Uma2 family endonuclease
MGQIFTFERSVAPPTDREVTPEELYFNQQWGHCELVDGKVIQMSPVGRKHARIAIKLAALLYNHVAPRKLGEVYGTDAGFIFPNGKTVRAPDLMFISSARIASDLPDEGFLQLVPDFAIEVISPDDRFTEVVRKAESYLSVGVKLIWVVQPDGEAVHVYRPSAPVQVFHAGDILTGEDVLPQFTIEVREIFAH